MKKIASLLFVLLIICSLFGVTAAESTTAEVLTDTEIEPVDESLPDGAYGAINPAYRISDSPYLRLPEDMKGWPPVVPPAPREVRDVKDPSAVEIYNITTGKVTRLPSTDITQQPVEAGLNSTPPYQGLLPPGIVPTTVFPPDDRVRVTPTNTYPWQTVCKLFITAADGTHWVCSGAIIGCPDGHGDHVLTAAHCIYLHDHGGWASSIEIVPGLDDDYMPYHHAWVTNSRTYTGWTQNQMVEHDWAVLTLDRNVGDFTGWMGRMTADPSSSIYTGILNTAGYPADKDCGTPGSYGLCMYFTSDYGDSADEYNHWYWLDTYGGQSGSPVWRYDGTSRHILTVNAYEYINPASPNFGTRLNQDKFDRIITWCNEDPLTTDYADLIDDGDMWSGFTPTTISPGDSLNVWCDVRNIGTASSGGFYVSYYASTNTYISTSDYLICTDYVSSISPFNWADSDCTGTPSIPEGTYYVGWIIDSGNDVSEFDESNNVAYKDTPLLTVIEPCGDMGVNPTSWSPTINAGTSDSQTVTVSASSGPVEGVTVSKVSGPAWLSVSPMNLGDIASGTSKTFSMIASPPSGTNGDFVYTVRVSNTCGTPTTRDVTGTIHVDIPCGGMTVNPTSWSPTINAGTSDSQTVTVSASSGPVEGVTVSKVSGPAWLSVSPMNLGDIASGTSKTFSMIASPPSGTNGDFVYTVRVSNTCGTPTTRDVTGTLHVEDIPCGGMTVNPTSWSPTINAGTSDSQTVTVSASGGPVEGVTVSKVSGPTWLSVSPTNLGDIASGTSKTFSMTASPPSGTNGDFVYTVRVSNTCGTPTTRDVTGTLHVEDIPCGGMTVSPTSWSPTINAGTSDSQTVTVSASGGPVEGVTVSKVSGPTWLSVSPTNLGDIASGTSKTFSMTASPPSGTSEDFVYTVRVSNTCGTPSSRDVTGTITVNPVGMVNVYFDPAIVNVGLSSTAPVNIILDEALNGLSGYNMTVSLSDPTVAEIVSVSFPSWATMYTNSALPADSVWIKAADLTDQITSGATNVNLATLTLRGDESGTSDILITVTKMDDDTGLPINPNTIPGEIECGIPCCGIIFPSCPNPATDPDGDGLCEDLNGNGVIDFNDVVVFFNYFDNPSVIPDECYLHFDYNGNGLRDFNDINELFAKV